MALKKLQGFNLQGRRMSLEFGVKKEDNHKSNKAPADRQEKSEVSEKGDADIQPSSKTSKMQDTKVADQDNSKPHINRTRQILVFGIPVDVTKKQFKFITAKVCRKGLEIELIKEVFFIFLKIIFQSLLFLFFMFLDQDHELRNSLSILFPPGKVMLLTVPSRQEAGKVIDVVNKNTIKSLGFGKLLEKQQAADSEDEELGDEFDLLKLKNRLGDRLVARSLADLTEIELRKRKCRVIIRNLSFQATQQNVIDKLKKFGPIAEVEIPTMTVNVPITDKMRKRVAVPDEPGAVLAKEKMRGFAFVTFVCENDARSAVEQSSGLKICNRDVAIDFSMSKDTYIKYGKENNQDTEDKDDKEIAVQGIDSVDNGEKMDSSDEDVGYHSSDEDEVGGEESECNDGHDDDDDENDADDNDDDAASEISSSDVGEEKEKPFDGDVNECKTVFIRGLPFDAAPIDLKKALGKFGKIEMALIVMDKNTGISKGSAFVKFSDPAVAEKCIESAKDGMTIKDRICKIDLAVDKDSAAKLKSEAKIGKDKRNLYLANEGLIADNAQSMSDYDRDKRLRAQSDKKKKLQNPLFFVSNNRLSIRNIGKQVTDNELRLLCLKATKLGLERGLVTHEDLKKASIAQGLQGQDGEVPSFDGRQCIKSAKIMFDPTKVRGGIPQSRGYAFIEFHNHAFALACLRQLNNNPQYENLSGGGPLSKDNASKSRLIAEFSLENIRKVRFILLSIFELTKNSSLR